MENQEESAVLELLSRGSVAIVKVACAPNSVTVPHASNQFRTIICVVQGSATVETPHETWELGPGDICELAPGVQHTETTGADGAVLLMGFN